MIVCHFSLVSPKSSTFHMATSHGPWCLMFVGGLSASFSLCHQLHWLISWPKCRFLTTRCMLMVTLFCRSLCLTEICIVDATVALAISLCRHQIECCICAVTGLVSCTVAVAPRGPGAHPLPIPPLSVHFVIFCSFFTFAIFLFSFALPIFFFCPSLPFFYQSSPTLFAGRRS